MPKPPFSNDGSEVSKVAKFLTDFEHGFVSQKTHYLGTFSCFNFDQIMSLQMIEELKEGAEKFKKIMKSVIPSDFCRDYCTTY
jgi:hypothetical protein